MFNKYLKSLPVLCLCLALAACGADVRVKTSLQGTKDVTEGEIVYLDNQAVGEVTDVSRSAGNTEIEIELDANGINSVMKDAAVVVNRLKKGAPLEIHNKEGSTEAVVDGQQLQGLDSMFQLGAWMVGDSIDLGSGAISDYVSAFQKYLQGDEWQQNKAEIVNQAQEAAKAAEVAVAGASAELGNVVQELKKAEEPMAQAVEELGAELAPVIGEISKSGQSIMQELQKLTVTLEQETNADNKEVGSRFFESLNKTLETINQSMEESLHQSGQVSSQVAPQQEVTTEIAESIPVDDQAVKAEPVAPVVSETIEKTSKTINVPSVVVPVVPAPQIVTKQPSVEVEVVPAPEVVTSPDKKVIVSPEPVKPQPVSPKESVKDLEEELNKEFKGLEKALEGIKSGAGNLNL